MAGIVDLYIYIYVSIKVVDFSLKMIDYEEVINKNPF